MLILFGLQRGSTVLRDQAARLDLGERYNYTQNSQLYLSLSIAATIAI